MSGDKPTWRQSAAAPQRVRHLGGDGSHAMNIPTWKQSAAAPKL